jgi:Ca2+-binding EF-hand superfamily protein
MGTHLPSSLPEHIRSAVVQAMNTPTTPPQQSQQFHQSRQSGWAIDPAEKSKYDSIFKTWDPLNTGYIDGERARNIFSQSGLGDNVLAHIWGLADRDRHGKLNGDEFAVAMCLLYRYLALFMKRKLAGQELPQNLPDELVPPSSRDMSSMANIMKNQV